TNLAWALLARATPRIEKESSRMPEAFANTRDACATQSNAIAGSASSFVSMRRSRWRSHNLSHRLQHSAQIAVGGDDCCCVFFKRNAHHVEASQKRVKFLAIG